jgi:hypothetical protein
MAAPNNPITLELLLEWFQAGTFEAWEMADFDQLIEKARHEAVEGNLPVPPQLLEQVLDLVNENPDTRTLARVLLAAVYGLLRSMEAGFQRHQETGGHWLQRPPSAGDRRTPPTSLP